MKIKQFILRYIAFFIFITAILVYNNMTEHPIIGLIIAISAGYLVFKLIRWLYSKIFYKVRNRILGIFLFTGFIPLALLVMLFIIIGYIFIFQTISLDLDYEMQKEIEKLKTLSSHINTLFLRNNDIDIDSLKKYIDEEKLDFENIILVLFNEDNSMYYHYGDSFLPYFEISDENYNNYLIFEEKPFIAVMNSSNGKLYMHSYLLAVPLGSPYTEYLSERLGGHFFVSFISFDEEVMDEQEGERSIIVRGPIDNLEADAPEGVNISVVKSQKAEFRKWSKGLPKGLTFLKFVLIKNAHVLSEGRITNSSMIMGIFHVDLRIILGKFLAGTLGYMVPVKTIFYIIAVITGLFLLAEVVSVLISFFFSFSITRIINQLHKKSKEIAKGNFPGPIASKRKDQLGEVTRTFDKMNLEILEFVKMEKEKQKLDNEISIAQMVQNTFFPKKFPELEGVEIFGKCIPAKMVSGDFYDISEQREGCFDFCIGDISGKGISASLLMAASLTYLRLESAKRPIPAIDQILNNFNRYLCEYSAKSQFCSLIYGRIYKDSLRMELINAGHPLPVIIRGDEIIQIETSNIVTGIIREQQFEKVSVDLQISDLIFLFTDGFAEVMTDKGYRFISNLVIDRLVSLGNEKLESIYYALFEMVKNMSSDKELIDDMTSLIIKIGPDKRNRPLCPSI